MKSFRAEFWIVFGTLYAAFFYPLFGMRSGFTVGDYNLQFYPWLSVYADALKRGYLLFWTPLIQSGFPLFAEGQTAMLYPVNWVLFGLLPFQPAYNLLFLLHFLLAGLGMYRLAVKTGQSSSAATLAAVCFTFGSAAGGGFYGQLGFRGLSLFPWALYFAEDFLSGNENRNRRAIFWVVLIQAQAWLTGPQLALYQTLFLTVYYFLRIAQIKTAPRGSRTVKTAWFFAAMLLSLTIAAPQLWATVELASHSTRVIQDPDFVLWGSAAPWSFGALFFYTWNSFLKCNLYIGCLPLLLIWTDPSWKRLGLWWALVFLSIFLALGRFNPLYWVLTRLPLFSLLRNPSKFLFFTAFFLSLIAGFSLDAWIKKFKDGPENFRPFFKKSARFSVLAACVMLSAWMLAHPFGVFLERFGCWYAGRFVIGKSFHRRDPSFYLESVREILASIRDQTNFFYWPFWLPFLTLTLTVSALFFVFRKKISPAYFAWFLLALVSADLLVYGKTARGVLWENIGRFDRMNRTDVYAPEDGKWLNASPSRSVKMRPNTNMISGFAHPGAYSPLLDKDYYLLMKDFGVLDDSFGLSPFKKEALLRQKPLVDFLGIRHVLAGSDEKLSGFRLEKKEGAESFYVNDAARPEFTWEPLSGPGWRSIRIVKEAPMDVEVETDAPAPGILMRNQVYDKGWKVILDGHATPVSRVRAAFQGVRLKSGRHRVRFIFDPLWWKWGRWISATGLVLTAAGLAGANAANKRHGTC